jgi:hypothetical protein
MPEGVGLVGEGRGGAGAALVGEDLERWLGRQSTGCTEVQRYRCTKGRPSVVVGAVKLELGW